MIGRHVGGAEGGPSRPGLCRARSRYYPSNRIQVVLGASLTSRLERKECIDITYHYHCCAEIFGIFGGALRSTFRIFPGAVFRLNTRLFRLVGIS